MKASGITDKLRQYPLAALCTVIIIVCAIVIFLRGGVLSELSVKDSDLTSRIRTINANVENSKNLKQDTEALATRVEKMNSWLFEPYERAINISFFYEFEEKTGVVISNISQLSQPDPVYSEGGGRKLDLHSTLVFNMTLSGSFSNVLSFFYEIDRAEPIMRVADFQLSHNEREQGSENVDVRVRLIVMADKD